MKVFGDNLPSFTHWFGWALALIASVVFVIFDIREWVFSALQGEGFDNPWFYIFLIIAVVGVGISLFKRITGGYFMLAGGISLVLLLCKQGGWAEANRMLVYGLPYILPGFLLLIVKDKKSR